MGRTRVALQTGKHIHEIDPFYCIAGKYRVLGAIEAENIIAFRRQGGEERYFYSRIQSAPFEKPVTDAEKASVAYPLDLSDMVRNPIDPTLSAYSRIRRGDCLVVKTLHREPPYEAGQHILFHDTVENIFIKIGNTWIGVNEIRFPRSP